MYSQTSFNIQLLLFIFFSAKPTSLDAFLTSALGCYSQEYVAPKYTDSKHTSVLLYSFPL